MAGKAIQFLEISIILSASRRRMQTFAICQLWLASGIKWGAMLAQTIQQSVSVFSFICSG